MADGPLPVEYLHFVKYDPREGLKMATWSVHAKRSGDVLGHVRWYGAWRCYTFYPEPGTLFNEGCLKSLATFCANATYIWRESRRDLKKVRGA